MYFNLSDNETIKAVVKAAFPDYSGKKAIRVNWNVKEANLASWWDSGSKTSYALVSLSNLKVVYVPTCHPTFERANYEKWRKVELPDGVVVVALSYYGSSKSVSIMTPGEAPMLPSGEDKISDEIVYLLVATRGLKSSYGGISDYRANALKSKFGWSQSKVDELRQQAIELGFMAKNKSITTEGKNAIENHPLRNTYIG